jgi:hypothetical protein
MNQTSSISLTSVFTYESPEEAIEGILKETENAAQKFSLQQRKTVEQSARALAEAARTTIKEIAEVSISQIEKFGPTIEGGVAWRESWKTAEDMRRFCQTTLHEAEKNETTKKLGDIKSKIQSASIGADVYMAPNVAAPRENKKLSDRVRQLYVRPVP